MGRNSTLSKRTQRFAEKNLADVRKTAKSARKTAASGWADINDAFDSAFGRSQHVAGDARSRLEDAYLKFHDVQDEGLRRTKAAKDALAGKQAPRRRPWVAAAAALGVAFGAMGVVYARRLARSRERALAEDAAAAVAADLQASDRDAYGTRLNGSSAPSTAYIADISTAPESSGKQ